MRSARFWGTVLGVIVVSQAYADHIFVSGDVTGTWAVDTVLVTGDVRVPPGETLVIDPGVKVLFQGHFKFNVDTNSTLIAVGALDDSILFDSFLQEWPDDIWHGIRFNCAASSSQIKYCHLRRGWTNAWALDFDDYGGGIFCYQSSPTIQNCLIENCRADLYGGGIALCQDSNPIIVNNSFFSNQANVGGAIYCIGSSPLIWENEISSNSAIWGGGIAAEYQSHPDIRNNFIGDNLAQGYNSIGAGIFLNESSWSTLCNNLIIGNFSYSNCGGLWCGHSSNATVLGNVIWGNHSYYSGGGISCIDADALFINNTIADNSSEIGAGGGLYLWDSDPIIMNSIFWNNTLAQIDVAYQSTPQIIYCNIQGGWPGTGNINIDPQFINPDSGDYHLALTSPCIDAGNPDPQYNDPEDPANPGFALWPALGTIRNDMGAYGGSGASGWVGIADNPPAVQPTEFRLEQNFPNPFNPTTVLSFQLPVASFVRLEIFDIGGRRVSGSGTTSTTALVNGWRQAGRHEVTFDGSDLSSGLYIFRLQAGDFHAVKKMILLK